MGTQRRTKGFIFVVALALVTAAPLVASIRPSDQRIAESLTLRFANFDSGWKIRNKASTQFRKTSCGSAPKIQFAITGFSDSAIFQQIDSGNNAETITRIFPSPGSTRTWFRWAAGPKAAACNANIELDNWRHDGYRVTGLSRAQESFPVHPDCGYITDYGTLRCFDDLKAWHSEYTVSKGSQSTNIAYDYVAVRYGHAVIAFHFFGGDYSVVEAQQLSRLYSPEYKAIGGNDLRLLKDLREGDNGSAFGYRSDAALHWGWYLPALAQQRPGERGRG